jgi:hypothetical protein
MSDEQTVAVICIIGNPAPSKVRDLWVAQNERGSG